MNYDKKITVPEAVDIIRCALDEDIGTRDVTTESLVHSGGQSKAVIMAKDNFVVCGVYFAGAVFKQLDKAVKFRPLAKDGMRVKKGEILATINASSRTILTGERVALNFLSFLSAVSTRTRKFVEAVKPYKARIMDTRKTLPGLRLLQKYAVRIGGGFNHRISLDEMVMVKDNHLKVIGGYKKIKRIPHELKADLEVENLSDFTYALKLKPDIIMLDNMPVKDIKKAVRIRNSLSAEFSNYKPKLEASGGINLKNVRKIAASGVDMISIGTLTSTIEPVDVSLEIM